MKRHFSPFHWFSRFGKAEDNPSPSQGRTSTNTQTDDSSQAEGWPYRFFSRKGVVKAKPSHPSVFPPYSSFPVGPISSIFSSKDYFLQEENWIDFDTLSTRGYQRNPLVFRCINLISQSLASVEPELYRDGIRLVNHPALDMLNRPNPQQNRVSFFDQLVKFLCIGGNSFIEATAPQGIDGPVFLYTLRPDRVSPLVDRSGRLKGYEYTGGGEKRVIPGGEDSAYSPLLHLKFFHPQNNFLGMSPLVAAQDAIKLHTMITEHNLAILVNAGCPSGVLILKGQTLPEEKRRQLKEDLRSIRGKGYGQTVLLDGNFEYQPMGLGQDFNFGEGRDWAAREIAQVFGIPPMCVGLLGEATYANYTMARQQMWEDTLLPRLSAIFDAFSQWISGLFGEALELRYNEDKIPALRDRRAVLSEYALQLRKINVLTVNELRQMLGYTALQGGDVIPSVILAEQKQEDHSFFQEGASIPGENVVLRPDSEDPRALSEKENISTDVYLNHSFSPEVL